MRVLQILFIGACLAALVNCQAQNALVVTAADPQALIEASYGDGERTIVLRAQRDGPALVSDIYDERGHSVTSLARTLLKRERIPVPALFSNAATLSETLPLATSGLQRLRESLPPAAAESALFADLSRQTGLLSRALATTKMAILQEWGSEARRRIPMSPREGSQFFALLGRQARAVGASSAGPRSATAADLAALLGPERYARYTALRKVWLSPAGGRAPEVLP